MTNERWLDIVGYEGLYQISDQGRLRGMERTVGIGLGHLLPGGIRKPEVHVAGYFRVYLYRKCKRTRHFIHRLVAQHFIPNPDGKPFVNHIDSNKQNNTIENLEWATVSENTKHYYDSRKPVPTVDVDEEIRPEDIPF